MITIIGIVGLILFLWGATSHGPKKIWRRRWYSSKDCWTKGWDFERFVMLQYVSIIVGGLMLAYAICPDLVDHVKGEVSDGGDGLFTGIFLIIFMIAWPVGIIYIGRSTFSKGYKQMEDAGINIKRVVEQIDKAKRVK